MSECLSSDTQKDRTLHAFRDAQLAHNAIQILGHNLVKLHGCEIDGTENTLAVHKPGRLL